jgi:hypothetical protein
MRVANNASKYVGPEMYEIELCDWRIMPRNSCVLIKAFIILIMWVVCVLLRQRSVDFSTRTPSTFHCEFEFHQQTEVIFKIF